MSESPITQTKEGKVNVALGIKEVSLTKQARIAGTSKTNFARMILVDALDRLESGEAVFRGPLIVPVSSPAGTSKPRRAAKEAAV